MRIKNIFLSLSLVVLLSASALAQSGEQVKVQIIDSTGKVIAVSNLDGNGRFSFSNLPAGSYAMKVSVQDFHFMKIQTVEAATFDKGTSAQTSTGKRIDKASPVLAKSETVEPVAAKYRYFMKIDGIEGINVQKTFLKIDGVEDKAAVADKSASLKFKPELTRASESVSVESWSWGTSNSIAYETSSSDKLKTGIDCFIKIDATKSFSGKVMISTYDLKANKK